MKKLFLTTMSFLGLAACSYGQKIERSVIASSGDYFKASGAQLSWTLGEVMDENYSNRTATLSQGFQQGDAKDDDNPFSKNSDGNDVLGKDVEAIAPDGLDVKIYPNPAFDFVTVNLGSAWEQGTFVEVVDLFGRSMLVENINEKEIKKLNVSSLPDGIYILQVKNNHLNTIKSFKINKIN